MPIMNLCLVNQADGRSHALDEGCLLTIGRDEQCDISVQTLGISRRHCLVSIEDGVIQVQDLESKNGTFLNGERITTGQAKEGDLLNLAKVHHFSFRLAQPDIMQSPVALALTDNGNTKTAMTLALPEQRGPKKITPKVWALIILIIIFNIFAVIAVINRFSGSDPKNDPSTLAQSQTHNDVNRYRDLLVAGMEAFNNNRFDTALSTWTEAKSMQPNRQDAAILLDLLSTQNQTTGNYKKFNLRRAESLTLELLELHPPIREVQAFAKAHTAWIRKLERELEIALGLEKTFNSKQWLKVLDYQQKLPEDGILHIAYTTMFQEAEQALRSKLQETADDLLAQEQWQQAIDAYGKLNTRLSIEEQQTTQSKIELCEKRINELKLLDRIEQDFKNHQNTSVVEKAAEMPTDSPYFEKAQDLKGQAILRRQSAAVEELYAKGKGQEALDYIKSNNIEGLNELSRRIQAVMEAASEADAALARREIDTAVDAWQRITELENFAGNPYRAKAQRELAEWGDDNRKAIAYKKWGDEYMEAKDYRQARLWYEKTSLFSPEYVEKELKQMDLDANRLYNLALNAPKRPAAKMLEEALNLFSPNHPSFKEAQDLYHKLTGTSGATLNPSPTSPQTPNQ